MKKLYLLLAAALISTPVFTTHASVLFTNIYSQNFDLLATTGTANAWANDSTLPGWSLFQGNGTAITAYAAGNGGVNTGSFYSFGTGTATERALGGTASGGAYFGSPGNGAVAGYIAFSLLNNSGASFDSFNISFDGEQWRDGGNTTVQAMVLQYGFGTTFASVTTWNAPGGSFDYSSPVHTASAAAVDGNNAGKVTGLGGDISALWNNGATLWVRWIDNNDAANDHGLGIDNVTVTTTAPIPEPSVLALATIGGLLGLVVMRRKR